MAGRKLAFHLIARGLQPPGAIIRTSGPHSNVVKRIQAVNAWHAGLPAVFAEILGL